MDEKQFNSKQMIMRYFKQITTGCGNNGCTNPSCVSSIHHKKETNNKISPKTALLKAIQLYRNKSQLCKYLENQYIPNAYKETGNKETTSTKIEKNQETLIKHQKTLKPVTTNLNKNGENFRKFSPEILIKVFLSENKNAKIDIVLSENTNLSNLNLFVQHCVDKLINLNGLSDDSKEKYSTSGAKAFLVGRLSGENGFSNSKCSDDENFLTELDQIRFEKLQNLRCGKFTIMLKITKNLQNSEKPQNFEIKKIAFAKEDSRWIDIFQRNPNWSNFDHSKKCVENCLKSDFRFYGETENDMILINNSKNHKLIIRKEIYKMGTENQIFSIKNLKEKSLLFVICIGGKFAAAIFRNGVAVEHTTLSRYVIRQKQGGRQISIESKHSAGSHMRLYHEKRLGEDIHAIFKKWQNFVLNLDLIYVHAPGKINSGHVFGPDGVLLNLQDGRISKFPLVPQKATFGDILAAEKKTSFVEWVSPKGCCDEF